jgi:hypothetical protein
MKSNETKMNERKEEMKSFKQKKARVIVYDFKAASNFMINLFPLFLVNSVN